MSLYFMIGVVFLATTSLIFIALLLFRRMGNPTLKRVKELDITVTPTSEDKNEDNAEDDRLNKKIERIIAEIGRFTKQDEKQTTKTQEMLIQAGYKSEDAVKVLYGLKIISTLLFFAIFTYIGTLTDRPIGMVIMLAGLVALVGYRLPDILLSGRIRKRQQQIGGGLPDALDLLVITVEAGLGLNAALLRVGEEMAIRCPSLSDEFKRVNQDLRTGIPREKALRNLSQRNQVEDLRIFVGALVLADRLGTSIADTLRAQADSLRTRIQQKAQEKAAKAGVKMLLPLILFVLPALIIILMGPGIISVIRTFGN